MAAQLDNNLKVIELKNFIYSQRKEREHLRTTFRDQVSNHLLVTKSSCPNYLYNAKYPTIMRSWRFLKIQYLSLQLLNRSWVLFWTQQSYNKMPLNFKCNRMPCNPHSIIILQACSARTFHHPYNITLHKSTKHLLATQTSQCWAKAKLLRSTWTQLCLLQTKSQVLVVNFS